MEGCILGTGGSHTPSPGLFEASCFVFSANTLEVTLHAPAPLSLSSFSGFAMIGKKDRKQLGFLGC